MVVKTLGRLDHDSSQKRVKSGIPKKESSIHLDLQILHSRKKILESELSVWDRKIRALVRQVEEIQDEIDRLEMHRIKQTRVCRPQTRPKQSTQADKKDKIMDMEY